MKQTGKEGTASIVFEQAHYRDQCCHFSGKPVNSSICTLGTENPQFQASSKMTAAGKYLSMYLICFRNVVWQSQKSEKLHIWYLLVRQEVGDGRSEYNF